MYWLLLYSLDQMPERTILICKHLFWIWFKCVIISWQEYIVDQISSYGDPEAEKMVNGRSGVNYI